MSIKSISPIDGRYKAKTKPLNHLFSEFGLIHFRLKVEIEWLIFMQQQKIFTANWNEKQIEQLREIEQKFSREDALKIKAIEKKINHDVKAVEYFLSKKLAKIAEFSDYRNWIHFACTSEDINNLAYGLMIQKYKVIHQEYSSAILNLLKNLAKENANLAMISLTHGQNASPTTLGKEIAVFYYRLKRSFQSSQNVQILGKFNGAVGNFNAHTVSFADLDWQRLSKLFVESLGLVNNPYTTQIEPHDYLTEIFDSYRRFNNILLDFSRDIWGYISRSYFTQRLVDQEVGSSTMPHKINPIDFENAEGNLALANNMLGFLSDKLPISRFQRDLTDSTILRNIGTSVSYQLIAYQSLIKGIKKLSVSKQTIEKDLNNAWELLTEPIQTVMRQYDYKNPYDQLKELSRGKIITKEILHQFIHSLDDLPPEAKEKLLHLTPKNYIGLAAKLAQEVD